MIPTKFLIDTIDLFAGAIERTRYERTSRPEIDRAVKKILKNVSDWENHRGQRRRHADPPQHLQPRVDFNSLVVGEDAPSAPLMRAGPSQQGCTAVTPEARSPLEATNLMRSTFKVLAYENF